MIFEGPAAQTSDEPYWSQPADQLLARLNSRREGLTEVEAAARLARDGPNRVSADSRASALQVFLRQVSNAESASRSPDVASVATRQALALSLQLTSRVAYVASVEITKRWLYRFTETPPSAASLTI